MCSQTSKTDVMDMEDIISHNAPNKAEATECETGVAQQCDLHNEPLFDGSGDPATQNPPTHLTSSDLALNYGDRFMEMKDTPNPYMTKKHEQAPNRVTISLPNEIVKPFSKGLDETKLKDFVQLILDHDPQDKKAYNSARRRAMRSLKTNYKKTELLYGYRLLCRDHGVQSSDVFHGFVQSKAHRSQSGVMVYAVFTHPFWTEKNGGETKSFSCKFNCAYCPEMPGQPRSYVPGEPGLDRANNALFDTVVQVYMRATSYNATGHVNDKAEVIVLGGTWHSYPLAYRRTFMRDLYYAFNTVHGDRGRVRLSLKEEMFINESAGCKVIGLTIETRPDQFSDVEEIRELRRMGVTRVQLGIQHTNDRLLRRIRRGCTSKVATETIETLKNCCFKVDIHLMPDLPKPFTKAFEKANGYRVNSKNLTYTENDIDWDFDSVAEDVKMLNTALHDQAYSPDQVKIYPCEVMDWTQIKVDHDRGLHKPYGGLSKTQQTNDLIDILMDAKNRIPSHIRINRLIRDIPESYVLGGINDASGRGRIEKLMRKKGMRCKCIRCREVRKSKVDPSAAIFKCHEYDASNGVELFLQYVTPDDKLIGFLRLRLSGDAGVVVKTKSNGSVKRTIVFDDLSRAAMIRELHVYGETVRVSPKSAGVSAITSRTHQHAGFGTRLVQKAFEIAATRGYEKIAVIPGEGVKAYYRRFGFVDGEHYLVKTLSPKTVTVPSCCVM